MEKFAGLTYWFILTPRYETLLKGAAAAKRVGERGKGITRKKWNRF